MTKVLLFSNLYPSSKTPTRGVFNRHVFGAIAEHCDARVVSPLPWWSQREDPDRWFFGLKENFTGLHASFPTYWSVPGLHTWHARGMYLSLKHELIKLHSSFPFEAILASWAYPDAAAAAHFARFFRVPLVTNVLGSDINALTTYPRLTPQIRATLEASARIISVSGALKTKMVEMGIAPPKIVVQHNGVDRHEFCIREKEDARVCLDLDPEPQRIVYVGNFVEEKGVDVLVKAFSLLLSQNENLRLSLVGSGNLQPRLREIVEEMGLTGKVEFHGRRSHEEIPLWMSAADLFCLPSLREGCPNVVLEALSSGVPVVASRVGGVPEILNETQGELTEAGNPQALSASLCRALEREWNPELLRDSVSGCSWTDVGSHYYRILSYAIEEFRGTNSTGFSI